jgi:hypothetical protein
MLRLIASLDVLDGDLRARLRKRHPAETTRIDFDVFRDGGDAEWWKHAVLRLWDERR